MGALIALLIGFVFGAFFTWCICRQGKGEMPSVDCIRPGDNKWIENEYFDLKCNDQGFEVMTH